MAMAANKTPQIDLLERDVLILFEEVRRLRSENEQLNRRYKALQTRYDNVTKEEREELGFYIKNQREALGLSLRGFAMRLAVDHTTLKNYEKGVGNLENMRDLVKNVAKIRKEKKG